MKSKFKVVNEKPASLKQLREWYPDAIYKVLVINPRLNPMLVSEYWYRSQRSAMKKYNSENPMDAAVALYIPHSDAFLRSLQNKRWYKEYICVRM